MLPLILWFSPNGLMDGFPATTTQSPDRLSCWQLLGPGISAASVAWRRSRWPCQEGMPGDVWSFERKLVVFVGADSFSYVYFQCSEFSHFMLSSAYPTTPSNSCPPKSNHKLSDLLPNLRSPTLLDPP